MTQNNDDQAATPLLDALIAQQKHERISAHVPGHKQGHGLLSTLARYAGPLAQLDATEVPGLDDLHHADGVIAKAQQLAAKAFGTEETYFLVAGSTGGNLAAILAVVDPSDVVIVGRNAHQSVWNALVLAQAQRVSVTPVVWHALQGHAKIAGGLSVTAIQEALVCTKQARALILTSPSYDGFVSDLPAIVQLAHQAGLIVIVDEAHGVHLPFHPQLPMSAIAAGADLVIQSAHKMGAGFTQTAFLHVQGSRVDRLRLQETLRIVQSSSPSYLLMASLDAMRSQLACHGEELLNLTLTELEAQKLRLHEACQGLLVDVLDTAIQDPMKWILHAERLHLTGFELERVLREQFGIYSEYTSEYHVLLSWSYGNATRDFKKTVDALIHVVSQVPSLGRAMSWELRHASMPVSDVLHVLTLHERKAGAFMSLSLAVGHRVVDPVTIYPPGIPLLLPGETFQKEHIEILTPVLDNGIRVDGIVYDEEYQVRCLASL